MRILADIGGTFARFALTDGQGGHDTPKKYRTDDFKSLDEALELYARETGLSEKPPLRIATAAHEEIEDGQTIWRFVDPKAWRVEPEKLQKAGWKAELVLNDFVAAAWGLVGLEQEGFEILRKGEEKNLPRCLTGPGTGLGLAYLMPLDKGGWHVQRTHGAHMLGIAKTDEQRTLMEEAAKQKKDGTIISMENLVSGPGLQRIHETLCRMAGVKNEYTRAQHILENAHDPQVKTALRLFHEFYGLFAQVAVITGHAYGGLYLTGGMTDRLRERGLFDLASFEKFFLLPFVDFVAHDIKRTQVAHITHPQLALRGLLTAAKEVAF